jgi:probable HAF family extracellular repeat protein
MVGLGDLPGGSFASFARGVSADGSVVVGQSNSASGDEAYRWTSGGGMVGLGDLAGGPFISEAWDVSLDGAVIVGRSYTGVGIEAFVWDAASGMRNLREVLIALGIDMTGWTLGTATAVADDGLGLDNSVTIVGIGSSPSGAQAWLAQIPEPSTAWLVGGGLVGVAALRRRTTRTRGRSR